MIFFRALALSALFFVLAAIPALAQDSPIRERLLGIPTRIAPLAPLPGPKGFEDHIVDGKLVLSLDAAIRLAMANNTDIHIDQAATDLARNNIHRQYQLFDPVFTSSFNDQRAKTQTSSQLQGAPVLNTLTQTTQFGYAQTFPTGTNFQSTFGIFKTSTNSDFATLNPFFDTSWSFQITQPLLKNFGTFPNRVPIYIAQRNLRQSQATFQAEVNDILLAVITQYWNVVLSRENLAVQQKSYEEAQQSYEHDKKALSLGALPPLNIYRSEAEVAARRVSLIQAEYGLKQAQDQFRQIIAANRDPVINALELNLTESAEPPDKLLDIDIASALSLALSNRPELEASAQQLASDALSIRLAHNNLRPDLELGGYYSPSGLGGNAYDITTVPPTLLSTGGLGDSVNQLFGLKYPTYAATLTLRLPIKNHGAEADLADASVSQRADQYRQASTTQSVTLDVINSVHLLEQAKLALQAAKISEDLAQKNLHAEERKYQLGDTTIFFVLDAQTQLATAEFALAQAQTSYQTAVASLDHATGKLLENHQVQILPAHK
jgi:outer membrane protein TolC